jgi:GNAT superfamily N-acetyltransferase
MTSADLVDIRHSPFYLRTELRPGDLGCLTYLHGVLYARERGWDRTFEAYVAAGLAEFVLDHDPVRERIWLAERGDELVGSIAIVRAAQGATRNAHQERAEVDDVGAHGDVAQLRWFLVHPDTRGQGLGRKLIGEALNFCHVAGYRRVILWTVSGLDAAAHLYRMAGVERVEARTHQIWGRVVTEERYELELPDARDQPEPNRLEQR